MRIRVRKTDIIVFFGLLCTSAFWLWRIRLGISEYDEAFYLTIPYRLTLGDTLLIDGVACFAIIRFCFMAVDGTVPVGGTGNGRNYFSVSIYLAFLSPDGSFDCVLFTASPKQKWRRISLYNI